MLTKFHTEYSAAYPNSTTPKSTIDRSPRLHLAKIGMADSETEPRDQCPSGKNNGVIANESNEPMDTNSVLGTVGHDTLCVDSGELEVLEKILKVLKEIKLGAKKMKNPEDGFMPLRIAVTRKDSDGTLHGGAHEIISVDTTMKTRRELAIFLKEKFRDIENSKPLSRRNIPDRCAWGKNYEVESVKAIWDTSSNGWNINDHVLSETVVHDLNCKDVLEMMKVRNSKGALSVVIAHSAPKEILKKGEKPAEVSDEFDVSDG